MEESFMEIVCQGFFIDILNRGICVGIVVAIDKFVVQRRDTIVPIVRRLQAALHIPHCLSVVSDTAPGITNDSLRWGTLMAVAFGIPSTTLAVSVVFWKGESLSGLVVAVVVQVLCIIFVWGYFMRARYRFDQGERDTFEDCSPYRGSDLWALAAV
ncbi:hypothetical protein F5Y08DRAFT_350405 [Xylaria arbuscula]|nr:hypothetical protein F5Y08DRAFT_350405 [Xylaria arbuscula]